MYIYNNKLYKGIAQNVVGRTDGLPLWKSVKIPLLHNRFAHIAQLDGFSVQRRTSTPALLHICIYSVG